MANSELYNQLLLKSSEEKLRKALDVRSIMRTNKYLKLLMHAILTKKGRYLIRNQQSQLLRIQSQIFSDSDQELTLSEPDNDIAENIDRLVDFVPQNRSERVLLRGLLQKKQKDIDQEPDDGDPASDQNSAQENEGKKESKKKKKRSRKKSLEPIPMAKQRDHQALVAVMEPLDSQTASDHDINDRLENNGFVRVDDSQEHVS